jgi:coenzyme F420-reducing hydrogenase beta subunit
MINVKKSLSEFHSLPKEEKVKKLKAMLEVVKEEGNIFDDLYNLLEIDPDVSEDILNMIYESMIKAMYSLQVEEIEKEIEKMEKIKSKVNKLQEEEEKERQEAEDILNSL